ncbi:MAG TPA: hypothetical protein VGC04_08255 [Cellulomonas sp.]
MTEVSTWANPVAVVVARDLTYGEVADLDRLRAVLASTVDRTDARAVSSLWDSMLTAHGGHPAPAGFVEAIATAIGDLLAVHVPGVHWSVWPGPAGPTLGVASDVRPHAPVVPFLDAQDRWSSGARDWILDYLTRAAAHLAAAALPQPRVAPDDSATTVEASPARAARPAPVYPEPAPAPVAAPEPALEPALEAALKTAPVAAAPTVPAAPAYVPDMPLEDFALDALDHAMALLRETGAFDREVFVLLLDAAGRRTQTCSGDHADARLRALDLVRSSGAGRAAITWIERDPADLPGPRQTFPAVVVDAWDAGAEGVRVGRRFVDDVLGTGPLGGRLVVGPVAPLL